MEENKEITNPMVTFAKPSLTLPLRSVGIIINDKISKDIIGLNDIVLNSIIKMIYYIIKHHKFPLNF